MKYLPTIALLAGFACIAAGFRVLGWSLMALYLVLATVLYYRLELKIAKVNLLKQQRAELDRELEQLRRPR